jgi:hypothetical protein
MTSNYTILLTTQLLQTQKHQMRVRNKKIRENLKINTLEGKLTKKSKRLE